MNKVYIALEKLCRWLDKVVLSVSGICLAALTILIFIQVICRYLFSNSLSWSEEIARYLEVWIVFICGAYALGRGQHVAMDLVINVVPEKVRFIFEKIHSLLFVFFSIFMFYYGVSFMIMESEQKMASLRMVPKNVVYLALPVSAVCMLIYSLMLLFKNREEASA